MSSKDMNFNPAGVLDLAHTEGFNPDRKAAFDFRTVFVMIRSNAKLIGIILGAAIVLTVLFTALTTPRYTAVASVQINNSEDNVLGNSAGDAGGVSSLVGAADTERFLATQMDILQSRSLAARVADKLKLASEAHFFQSQGVNPPGPGASVTGVHNEIISILQNHLKVDLPRDSRIATISFESTNASMSAAIANTYASEFIQSNLQRKFDSSAYARDFVANQLVEEKQKLEESEHVMNDYARSVGLINMGGSSGGASQGGSGGSAGGSTGGGGSVTQLSLVAINQDANDAKAKRIVAETRWNAINKGSLMNADEVISNATISALLTQRSQVEMDLAQDRSKHLDDFPSVKAKQAQLAGLNQEIQATATGIKNAVRSDYQAALHGEQELDAEVSQLTTATLSEQDRTVKYGLLQRDVETNQEVYDGLLQRFKELNASAGITLSNVSIVDSADVPGGPSSPNLMKNLAIGLVLGIAIAAATVFVKDQMDDSIRIPEDIEAKLSLPLLGVVPRSDKKAPEDALRDPKSPITEAYNSLRGSLMYSTPEGLPHVILVTSSQPAEGKSTSCYATAVGFARMGKNVVLIDADMRRPSLHRRIDFDNDRGLSTLLTTREPVSSVVMPAAEPNLTLMTSGPIPPSPTELISSARTEEVLRDLASQYDLVLIDSPPVLGLADAPMLAALVDGVMFVVEADRSRRGSLKAALRRLRSVRPVLLGAVLTKFDPSKGAARYSSYYGYEYYQYQYSYAENAQ